MQAIRSRRRTAALCTAGAALSLAAFAPSAFAGTAQVAGGQVQFIANPGELNDVVVVQPSATQIRIAEKTLTVTPGAGCVQETTVDPTGVPTANPKSVLCNLAGVTSGLIDVGDRSDGAKAKKDTLASELPLLMLGGLGNDSLRGGDVADEINGGPGLDDINGNGGADILRGEADNDTFFTTGSTPDTIYCGDGVDKVIADQIEGSPKKDNIPLNDCEDVSDPLKPAPPVAGGTDPTTAVRPRDVARGTTTTANLPAQKKGACAKEVLLTQGADRKNGSDDGDMMFGLGGNDLLNGVGGDDCLLGGEGNDTLAGSTGNDRLEGQVGTDRMTGGTGNDGLLGAAGNDVMDGSAGNDVLDGGAGRDKLTGGAGNDVLTGGAGNDTITGGAGRNVIGAGAGADIVNAFNRKRETINCGTGRDRVVADRADRLVGCERVTRR